MLRSGPKYERQPSMRLVRRRAPTGAAHPRGRRSRARLADRVCDVVTELLADYVDAPSTVTGRLEIDDWFDEAARADLVQALEDSLGVTFLPGAPGRWRTVGDVVRSAKKATHTRD